MSDNTSETLLHVFNTLVTLPSLVGTFLMTYYCFRSRKTNTTVKLLLTLAISDFIYSFSNLMSVMGSLPGSTACNVEGILRDFSSKLSICTVMAIALLHYKVIESSPAFNRHSFLICSTLGGILVSLCFSLRYYFTISVLIAKF